MSVLDLSIAEMGRRLRDRSLSSVALTQAHLDRIGAVNSTMHAFVAVAAERALSAAARADECLARGSDLGPLHGIPIGVKDLIDVSGLPTACGSRLSSDRLAVEDAEVVRRLSAGGAIMLGKTATYEFGLVGPSFDGPNPPAVNPWQADRITGGSSSGSAAAVAAGTVRSAIGTDTGGSIRSPAAYCGVVGFKPTFGRVSRQGVVPLSASLDHVGVIAASVSDAALTYDVIAGHDERDPGSAAREDPPAAHSVGQGIEGLRIAYGRTWFADDPALMPEVLSALDDAVSQLSLLGARVTEIDLPDYALMEAAGAVILHSEALAQHRSAMQERGADYGRQAFQKLAAGVCLTKADLAAARRVGAALCDAVDAVMAPYDAVVTATTLTTAPPVPAERDPPRWTPMRTLPFNLTGHPAVSVPIGFAGGLPIAMQIVGKAFDEARVLRIGAAFEAATDHTVPKPRQAARHLSL